MQTNSVPPTELTKAAEQDARVSSEQIRMVAQGSKVNLLAGMLAALLLVGGSMIGDERVERLQAAAVWCGLLILVLLNGIRLAHKIVKKGDRDGEVQRLGPWIAVNAAVAGTIWGAATWILLPTESAQSELFLLVGSAMVLMGGAGAQAAYRPMVSAFTFTLSCVLIAGLIRLQDLFHYLCAAAFAIFWFVTVMSSRILERTLRDRIRLAFQLDLRTREAQEAHAQSEAARREAEEAQKASEAARQESEVARREAELASRAKTVFLSSASHDMRQPLHALGVYLGFLKRKNTDPNLTNYIQFSRRALDALNSQLDSMLDISKIAAGTMRPTITVVPLQSVLDRLLAQLKPLADEKRLYFEVTSSKVHVETDGSMLERVLVNLTSNAIRYTNTGRVIVRCKARSGVVRCTVLDSGIGIPANELTNIYEPFYQVANSGRDRRKGLGMGLAIVRQLCFLLGFPLRVRSVPGKGSVFTIDVPIAEGGATQQATVEAPESSKDFVNGAYVVLIENDREGRVATAEMLRELGCRVRPAASAESAISKIQGMEVPPDMIIADFRLDDETGIEAIRIVTDNLCAAFGDEFWIPCLIMSGDTSPEVLREVENEGYPLLHKPVSLEKLYLAMNKALESRREMV